MGLVNRDWCPEANSGNRRRKHLGLAPLRMISSRLVRYAEEVRSEHVLPSEQSSERQALHFPGRMLLPSRPEGDGGAPGIGQVHAFRTDRQLNTRAPGASGNVRNQTISDDDL